MNLKDLIYDIVKNRGIENQTQLRKILKEENDVDITQVNIQYHLNKLKAFKQNGFYKLPLKEITLESKIKSLILDIKENLDKKEIYLFCLKDSSLTVMNAICQSYKEKDLCFKFSHSAEKEILTIETKFSDVDFSECVCFLKKIIKE